MSKKNKFSYEEKLYAMQCYEQGKRSFRDISIEIGAGESTVVDWWMIYQSQGPEGLKRRCSHKYWDKNIKIAAVEDYLSGEYSLRNVCMKYEISDTRILRQWIKLYNDSHKNLKTTYPGGKRPMTKARKTTFEERIEIVQFCIANSKNYGLTMDKFNVSYQQIYLWVRKYEEKGIDGLLDRRGKSKSEDELTELDRLKAENKMLEAKNRELEMEIDIIKKLQEVERRFR